MSEISAEFLNWFGKSGINRMHLIQCWLAWEKRSKAPVIGVPGKIICNAPVNCSCGYQVKPEG